MRVFRLALFCIVSAWPFLVRAAEPASPTVIVAIPELGAERLAALKTEHSVRWSAEFGNELLLGVAPEALGHWLQRDHTRAGPSALAPDEIVVRAHHCGAGLALTPLAVVGGWSLERRPPSLAKYLASIDPEVQLLPADGVFARAAANTVTGKQGRGTDPRLSAITARVDSERWFQTMSSLASFNRNSFSPQLGAAHNWIQARLGEAGLSTSSFSYQLSVSAGTCNPTPPSVQISNPIGEKRGLTRPDEWIVVGAHYDSRNESRCDGTAAPQPGANDNASGCAGVIELARVFATVDTERSIRFMCFSGEEQGLVGSRQYVASLQSAGTLGQLVHMLNLDMIGHAIDDTLAARIETSSSQQVQLNQYAAAAADYAPELGLILVGSTAAYSDHWYFLNAGIPAVFAWENGAVGIYPDYHKSTDLPANMQRARPLAGGILKMSAAVIAQQAGLSSLFADGFED